MSKRKREKTEFDIGDNIWVEFKMISAANEWFGGSILKKGENLLIKWDNGEADSEIPASLPNILKKRVIEKIYERGAVLQDGNKKKYNVIKDLGNGKIQVFACDTGKVGLKLKQLLSESSDHDECKLPLDFQNVPVFPKKPRIYPPPQMGGKRRSKKHRKRNRKKSTGRRVTKRRRKSRRKSKTRRKRKHKKRH